MAASYLMYHIRAYTYSQTRTIPLNYYFIYVLLVLYGSFVGIGIHNHKYHNYIDVLCILRYTDMALV